MYGLNVDSEMVLCTEPVSISNDIGLPSMTNSTRYGATLSLSREMSLIAKNNQLILRWFRDRLTAHFLTKTYFVTCA